MGLEAGSQLKSQGKWLAVGGTFLWDFTYLCWNLTRPFLIHWHYRTRPVALLLDANSCHTAHGSLALAQRLGIQFLWLPTRSPHLNPLEHLWRHAKGTVCANHQYPTLEEQVDHFVHYLQSLSPTQRLHKAGVFSRHFWLQKL